MISYKKSITILKNESADIWLSKTLIGQSLNIGLSWDGYDIPNMLSRGVEVQ